MVNRSSILKFNKNLELITEKAVSFNWNYKFVYPYIVYSSGLKNNKFSIFDVNNLEVEIKKDLNEFLGYSDTSATLLDFDFFKNGNNGSIALFKVASKNNPSDFISYGVSFDANSYIPNKPAKAITSKVNWNAYHSFQEYNSKYFVSNSPYTYVFDPVNYQLDSVYFDIPIKLNSYVNLSGELFSLSERSLINSESNLGIYKINSDFTPKKVYSFPTHTDIYHYLEKELLGGDRDSLMYLVDWDGFQYWNKNTNEIRIINPKIFVPKDAIYGIFIYNGKFCYFTLHGLYYCKGNYKN